MNAKIFVLAAAFILSVPVLTLSIAPASIAAAPAKLEGSFTDSEYAISVFSKNGALVYQGTDIKADKSISLKRVTISGNAARRVYTWSNSGTRYIVSWQPKDPDYVRLQVISPNGKTMMNRLLSREDCC